MGGGVACRANVCPSSQGHQSSFVSQVEESIGLCIHLGCWLGFAWWLSFLACPCAFSTQLEASRNNGSVLWVVDMEGRVVQWIDAWQKNRVFYFSLTPDLLMPCFSFIIPVQLQQKWFQFLTVTCTIHGPVLGTV